MTLFAEYNSPYLFAIAFVFFIGVLEMISLIFGHFLSGTLDAHLDHYDALSSGPAGQALHYLNIGRVPALVVLCLLAVISASSVSSSSMAGSCSGKRRSAICCWSR